MFGCRTWTFRSSLAALAVGILVVPASAAAETLTTTATLTPTAPALVTTANPVRADVDFGTSFTSVDSVCFTLSYQNDVLEAGEEIGIGFPPVIQSGGMTFYNGGAIGQSAQAGTAQNTMCLAALNTQTELFLDGQQEFYVLDGYPAPTGSLVLSSVTVRIEGVRALPTTFADCDGEGWLAFQVFKTHGDCVSFVATGGNNPPAG